MRVGNWHKGYAGKSGIVGVSWVTRKVKAKNGELAVYGAWQARGHKFGCNNGDQLYWGPDFFEACCARKSFENRIWWGWTK